MRAVILALTAMGLSACATTNSGPGPNGPAWTEIEISEGMCYGRCPVYLIRVTPDDRYQLTGVFFTRHDGDTSGTLDAGSFQRLAAVLQAHDAAFLPADITRYNPVTCGSSFASDMPSFRLSLTDANGRQDILWHPGCAESPYRDALTQIRAGVREAYDYETLIAPKR